MTASRPRKIGNTGELLDDAAERWAAVWLPELRLCFAATPVPASPGGRDACARACRGLSLLGRNDWTLPAVDELQWLLQRERYARMFRDDLLPGLADAWCWSATPAAWADSIGWGIDFDDGWISHRPIDRPGHALAVLRDPAADGRIAAAPGNVPMAMKLDAAGRAVDDDAAEWSAVYLPRQGLIFSAGTVCTRGPQPDCAQTCSRLRLCGWDDWKLPDAAQMQWLIDRSRHRPATFARLPLHIGADWYWTAQHEGWEQALVGWIVDFDDGFIGYQERDYGGLALAVRTGIPRG